MNKRTTMGRISKNRRGARGRVLSAAALFVAILSAATLANADSAARRALSGAYENLAVDHGRAAIEEGIDRALNSARRIIRGMARPRLLKNNPPVERLEIQIGADEASVAYDQFRRYRGPLGERAPQTQDAPEGGKVRVHYRWEDNSLVEIAEAREGIARIRYTLEGERLRVETSIESQFLPAPIRFMMFFRRA